MSIKELGKYQWEWLNKYGMIKLNEWRFEILTSGEPDWYYVGSWYPTEIKPLPSNKDGGYEERRKNLINNPYFYWPCPRLNHKSRVKIS